MKRKIYDKLLAWKRESADKYALLVEGARRVGKSWIVEEFAKNEYKKFLIIDFAKTSRKNSIIATSSSCSWRPGRVRN